MKLRPYQRAAEDAVYREWKTVRSTLAVLPTGTGKTVLFADVIRRSFPKRALVLAHREELIFQAKAKVEKMTGFRVDVEMGDARADLPTGCLFGGPQVIVSSIQTQTAGGDGLGRMSRFDPLMFGILIIDEAHHATADSYRRVLDYYGQNPNLCILGVTATPDRADETALGQIYESVAFDYEVLDAIRDGWLVPVEQQMVNVEGLDYSGIRTTAGDLNGADLAAVLEEEKALHGIVTPTLDIIGDRRTLVFAASVAQAERLCEVFNRHRKGSAAWICGKTDKVERRKALLRFADNTVQIMVNVGVLTEGYDNPGVQVVVMARPTKSRSLYAQMAGRATRPLDEIASALNDIPGGDAKLRCAMIAASKKPSCLIIDFAGNAGKHKLITSADILGGKASVDALQNVMDRARKSGKPTRMDEAIAEEEQAIRQERQRKADAFAASNRERVTVKAKWNAQNVNPFDTFQIQPGQDRAWDQGKKLTDGQRNVLLKQKIDPDSIPYGQARQLLNELFRRWDAGLASFGQLKQLRKFDLPVDVTREAASQLIDAVAGNGWKRPSDATVTTILNTPPGPKPIAAPISERIPGACPPPWRSGIPVYEPVAETDVFDP